jgi:hypothetical protein
LEGTNSDTSIGRDSVVPAGTSRTGPWNTVTEQDTFLPLQRRM